MDNQTVQRDVINRLRTVKGHLAGIEKMVEQGQNCSDILLQLGAIRSAVSKVAAIMAEHYALECYDAAIRQGSDPRESMKRTIQAMIKSNG